MNLNKLFLSYCKINNLEINSNQLGSIEDLNLFYNQNFNKSFLKKILSGNKSAWIIPDGIFLGQFFSITFKFFSIIFGKCDLSDL